jgi:CheY-like chemotaxis protein
MASRPRPIPLREHSAAKRLAHATVLVAEDDVEIRAMLRTVLTSVGAVVLESASVADTLVLLRDRSVDAVVLDWHLAGAAGDTVLAALEAIRPGLAKSVLVVTGDPRVEIRPEIAAAGVSGVLLKPFLPIDLVAALADTLDRNA